MPELIIGPLLRHVTASTATIWVETDQRCTVEVLGHQTSTFHVAGHHYALVVVRDLQPGSCQPYDVRLDGEVRWPAADSALPPTLLRTLSPVGDTSATLRVLFGSCRTAAPHEPPWTLELSHDPRGRGVDALWAVAQRMATQPVEEWVDLIALLGDQVYADDSSPQARERIAERRRQVPAHARLPPELVDGFEEFTWLYHESWSSSWERWFLSVVPSVMIFDDHEMIDDWNMSESWVRDIRREEWWEQHVTGGLMTYWLYQHLGNLGPDEIDADGMLAELQGAADGAALLRAWAQRTDEGAGGDGYRFSFARHLGSTKLVMMDSRNGRVLDPDRRAMVDDAEWAWIVDECAEEVDHLLIGTSLPMFLPGAMHDLEVWNEAVAGGAWRRGPRQIVIRGAEWVRRAADLEDWAAFVRSYDAFADLLASVGTRTPNAPASICVLSGDIHFSFHAEIRFPAVRGMVSRVHQCVSSPIRNALTRTERNGMRLAMNQPLSFVGRLLRGAAGRPRTALRWRVDHGPEWANCIGRIEISGRTARLTVDQAITADDADEPRLVTAFEVELTG